MAHYSYFNYPKIFEDYSRHFELVLIYSPQPGKESTGQLERSIGTALQPVGAVPLHLPLAFRLMVAGQLGILTAKGFGELSAETSLGKKEAYRMQIHMGTSYQEYIQLEELVRIRDWCEHVIQDWLHQQCQRSPKRHFPMIDQ